MRGQLCVAITVMAFHRGFLDGPVHPLDLAVGPAVLALREPVLDPILAAAHVVHVGHPCRCRAISVARRIVELDAIVGDNSTNLVGNSLDPRDQEHGRRCPAGSGNEADEGKLSRLVDGDIEIQLAFAGAHLDYIDVDPQPLLVPRL